MKLTLDSKDWSEPRFEAFRRAMGWTQAEAIGVLALFWHATREDGIIEESEAKLLTYLPVPPELAPTLLHSLILLGYVIQGKNGMCSIGGNERPVSLIRERREWGKRNKRDAVGKLVAQASKPAKPKPEKKKPKPQVSLAAEANRECWLAYSGAYQERYRVEPLRDARANAMIAQFVKRIGQDKAPEVIRFFVDHSDMGYVKAMHSLNCAVRDADALHTQWQRGVPITGQDLRLFEQQQQSVRQLVAVAQGRL